MTSSKKGLMEQDLSKLDVTKLHPLSPEVISRQATINIGTIGHVAHGKSTVVNAISSIQGMSSHIGDAVNEHPPPLESSHDCSFKTELERNITIKLGYANAKIYKCEDDRCPRPMCYKAYGCTKEDSPLCDVPGFENCRMKLLRHVSFVDCPGHDILMATMLNGATIMDGALLLIAANESCPQPQTSEHLAAVEIMRLKHIIILQNKVDLIHENVAINQHEAIQRFIQGTVAEGAPVVPISAQLKYNIDAVCEYIVKKIPIPERNFTSPPNMIVIWSFDVNKPGSEVDDITGGVAGGSILRGVLKVNQLIEVRPGIVVKDENGNIKCTPIYSRIVSLHTEENLLQFAVPGGLIGVGTTMDPTLTRADRKFFQEVGLLLDMLPLLCSSSSGTFGMVLEPYSEMFLLSQQLFQRDAQTITPEVIESVKAALASSEIEHKAETKKKAIPRKAAGQAWEDPTLADCSSSFFLRFPGNKCYHHRSFFSSLAFFLSLSNCMDLETENRIAAILMNEAAELRRQAEKEGVHAYLQQPKVRGRPNSRFLTATVLGVQQANRSVEVNEMWRVRQKELELNDRLKGRSREESNCSRHTDVGNSSRSSNKRHGIDTDSASASCLSSKRAYESSYSREDEGLRDEEIEKFLQSRVKRGRGAVGSRMDETGPYLPPSPDSNEKLSARYDVRQHSVFGPEKPPSLKSKKERSGSRSSNKKHSRKHKSKEKSHRKKKREE
ncbi:hypothetical protein EZV62_000290 [Acer yangbiense]|uniref:protein-synthesizing GTPase n=1 Tax=Acer yangbiense TaxID=1000413 RepID=A0A5C7IQY3_9ROSI|nr:hypothetical protein EZV62_000290 [Acer yangbiense]